MMQINKRHIVPCTILLLTRDQAQLFRHVEAEFGRPDPFDDAGDDPDYAEHFLVDLDDLRKTNALAARWIEQRGYPSVVGCRVTPYEGNDRVLFAEAFPEGTWNGYWDVKACALFALPPHVVQARLHGL